MDNRQRTINNEQWKGMKTIRNFNFKNKKVLVRCDFDIPLDERGQVLDDFRIEKSLSTIQYLINQEAKVILIGHAGRPGGRVVESLRLTPIQKKLTEYLGISVQKTSDCIGQEVERSVEGMRIGDVLLLENVRFHKEEEENNEDFAKDLAKLADFYINNAFANSHRNHASMAGIPKYLPSAAGFALEEEIEVLGKLTENPEKPLIAIIGGKKVETGKLEVINKLSKIGDWVLIGGLVKKAIKEQGIVLKYPQKVVEPADDIPEKDINLETIALFKNKIVLAKTVFWNGPLGLVEKEEFSNGSEEIAQAIIKSGAFSIIGGGDTVGFINRLGLIGKFNHVSTGGGAMLAFLAGEKMPGIEKLKI
jgi:3-phosphoglycerate kinase